MQILKNDEENMIRAFVREIPVNDWEWIMNPAGADEGDPNRKKIEYHYLTCSQMDGMRKTKYLELLKEYEMGKPRAYTVKKMRFGVFEDLMLPINTWDEEQLKKIARSFADRIRGSNAGLKWIAYWYQQGKATFIRVWISDREKYYVQHLVKPVYAKTQYINSVTGVFCSSKDPNAKVLYRKGQAKKITEKKYTWFAPQKTRIFAYAKEKSCGEAKRAWLLDCLMFALRDYSLELLEGFMFKRRKMKAAFSRWIKRCVVAQNKAQQYVEEEMNYWWTKERSGAPMSLQNQMLLNENPSISNEELSSMKLQTDFSRGMKKLYLHLQRIFSGEDSFCIGDVDFDLKPARCDITEKSCNMLKRYFDEKLRTLITTHTEFEI